MTERQKRRQQRSSAVLLREKQRMAEARTSAEKLSAEFDMLRLLAKQLPPGERDRLFDEVAEIIRRRRVTLGDFTLSTSHRTSHGSGRIGAPQPAEPRTRSSLTTTTRSEQ